jgi:hypothetical protein
MTRHEQVYQFTPRNANLVVYWQHNAQIVPQRGIVARRYSRNTLSAECNEMVTFVRDWEVM